MGAWRGERRRKKGEWISRGMISPVQRLLEKSCSKMHCDKTTLSTNLMIETIMAPHVGTSPEMLLLNRKGQQR
jgi:hypothetical protein